MIVIVESLPGSGKSLFAKGFTVLNYHNHGKPLARVEGACESPRTAQLVVNYNQL
jgi:hypothetical protein